MAIEENLLGINPANNLLFLLLPQDIQTIKDVQSRERKEQQGHPKAIRYETVRKFKSVHDYCRGISSRGVS